MSGSTRDSNGDIFTREDKMLFSHVKISSFRVKAYLVVHWFLYNNKYYYHLFIMYRLSKALFLLFQSIDL